MEDKTSLNVPYKNSSNNKNVGLAVCTNYLSFLALKPIVVLCAWDICSWVKTNLWGRQEWEDSLISKELETSRPNLIRRRTRVTSFMSSCHFFLSYISTDKTSENFKCFGKYILKWILYVEEIRFGCIVTCDHLHVIQKVLHSLTAI